MVADYRLDFGLVQVYTGDGKGKTTAALGQALRAVGRGLRVYMAQFIKGQESGEHLAAQRLCSYLTISQLGTGEFIINREPTEEELALAQAGWSEISQVVQRGGYDLVILDEISHAVKVGLITIEQVLGLISKRPKHVEMILTGRDMQAELIAAADLVTEMRCVRHPYDRGLKVRKGIEY
ncbi:MAG: cob(I)yrinic acid a,c-diamide adenosyltransferase [Firmicutes bacterium]|nr:cob(I)yrinic acid a,c-diamide adenosyltransferase [Bacillota bacterium]